MAPEQARGEVDALDERADVQHPDAERLLRLAAARDGEAELRRLAAELLAGRQG